jgi:hypothetical protein
LHDDDATAIGEVAYLRTVILLSGYQPSWSTFDVELNDKLGIVFSNDTDGQRVRSWQEILGQMNHLGQLAGPPAAAALTDTSAATSPVAI